MPKCAKKTIFRGEKGKTPYRNRALLIFSGIHAENWNHESSSARFLSVRILSKN